MTDIKIISNLVNKAMQ